jgi:FADH2-dependent halogenase
MGQTIYDAVIIGGGPGGSSAATFLAKAGKRVLVLEKEHFPRFHIGESLLPYNQRIFREMGVMPALEAAGFTRKYGAQFHLGNSSKSLKLNFQTGCFTGEPMAFQVERAKFDDLLLKHAQSSGAEVRQGWTVTKTLSDAKTVQIEARGENGETETFTGLFLIDASGRANFTGNRDGLREIHPDLKKLAIFGHFEGVKLDGGAQAGDILVVRLEDKWFWLIPLSPQKVSIGCVMDQTAFAQSGLTPAEMFTRAWQSSDEMRARMCGSRLVSVIQATTDFSYHNRRLAGPRLLRVGDAAGFMDPVFSAGVYLAMYSGKLAAKAIQEAIASGSNGARQFRAYEKRVFHAMKFYTKMVEAFYTKPFMELFLQPRDKFKLPDAIVAILAGELEGGWKIEWRTRLFFWLVKMQSRWPLVPRISFEQKADAN